MTASLLSAPTLSLALRGAGWLPAIDEGRDARSEEMVLRLSGEAGVRHVGALSAALLPLSACRPRVLILDLGGLTHLSCLAAGVLAEFCRGVVRHGCRVRLADVPHESVRAALARAGLLELSQSPGEADGY
jgi:anti-anti-sigma factor